MTTPSHRGLNAALAAAILPDRADTLVLRACLLDASSARAAWDAWRGLVGDPKVALETETRGLKGLLPLVDAAARAHGFPGPDGLGIYLKASALREELRARLIAAILARVVDALEAGRIPFTLLGGLVAAQTVYATPILRHCHAIELLVAEEDRARAAAALAPAGFMPRDLGRTEFVHTDGLTLRLWRDIAFHPHHEAPDAGVMARAVPLALDGRTVPSAGATDRMLMALSRGASTAERGNLRWACDAWLTAPQVNWTLLLDEVTRRHLELPVSVLCHHLAGAMDAPIPGAVLAQLDAAAAHATDLDREAAMAGALTGFSAVRRALAAPGVEARTRWKIARFLALPSARCLAWSHEPAGPIGRTLQRLHRPVGYVISRSRRRLGNP